MNEVDHDNGEDRDLHERLEKLSGAIEKKRLESAENVKRDAEQSAIGGETGKAMGQGFRMLAELVSGVLVGAIIGWQLDQWSGMSPLFLIVFLILGVAAGFWNMMRSASVTVKRK
jgi:ATP synthase protein I